MLCYAFSAFEGDIQTPDNITGQYRIGAGLISPLPDPNDAAFTSTLRPVKDKQTIERLLKDYERM